MAVTVAELGELGLLRELEARGLARAIANDAAELADGLVITQDALLEGVHFCLDWTPWRELGFKAAAVNLSDLAASGAAPEALLVSLGLPRTARLEDVLALYEGLNEPGVPLVGGDTTSAESVYLSVTALGRSPRVPGRAGARPGDALVVTGSLGGSAAGYLALANGIETDLVRAHLRPPLRLAEGQRLAAYANAMLDLSDGLATDARRIAERSDCRLVIELDRLPLADGVASIAEQLGRDVWELACGFGEDYELLAAVPPGRAGELGFAVVGRCEAGSGVSLTLRGRELELRGFEHFT